MVQDEDYESFLSPPQEISEFCDYRSTYGSVKPLRKDLLLAYFDRENYDPDELDEVYLLCIYKFRNSNKY